MANLDLRTTPRRSLGRTYAIIAVFIVLLSGLLVYNLTDYVAKEKTLIENAKKDALEKTKLAAVKMDSYSLKVKQIADQVAQELEAKHYSKQAIEERVHSVIQQNPEVFQFTIAFKPYKYDAGMRLYAPTCDRKDGVIRQIHLEDIYDYSSEKTVGQFWYIKTLRQGAGWGPPYFGDISRSLLSEYCVPFYQIDPVTKKKEIAGVVSIDFSLDEIEKFTKALHLGGEGYAYLISREGTYISHPVRENVLKQRKFSSNPDDIDQELAKKLLANTNTPYEFKLKGQEAWVIHQLIPSTGYQLGAIFIKDTMVNDKNLTRHKFVMFGGLALLILALLSVFVTKGYHASEKRLWGISIFISVMLVLAIGLVWYVSTKYNTYSDSQLRIVTDEVSIQSAINEKLQRPASTPLTELTIPTGVFIQSLEFENANDVKLTGYVWQKYSNVIPETISREIVFPEAISSSIEEAYVRETEEGQTIVWRFDATLRQQFDYSKYPLDNKDVWLRIWPKDFDQDIILVPDFSSYKLINPDLLPGIASDIILSGWKIKQSFFCYYTTNKYNTTFGSKDNISQDKYPELAYMTLISRKFMNPFITYLLPFVVMAFVLFGTLALIYILESKAEKFDFSAAGVLAACTSLFFSVVVTHNGLRESITFNGVLYLEYFYLILYAATILVIIDAFLVAFNRKSQFIQYKDNIIPKILYWPSLLGVILAITIRFFY